MWLLPLNFLFKSHRHQWNYTQWRKKNAFFSPPNNCNFFNFQYKKIMLTPKQPVINAVLITYVDYSITEKLYRKDGVFLTVHTPGASPQSSASHLLTFLVAQLQFLREWKLSDRRLYEVFERRLLIWGNPKERKTITLLTTTHFKNMRSFCVTLYIAGTNKIFSSQCWEAGS